MTRQAQSQDVFTTILVPAGGSRLLPDTGLMLDPLCAGYGIPSDAPARLDPVAYRVSTGAHMRDGAPVDAYTAIRMGAADGHTRGDP